MSKTYGVFGHHVLPEALPIHEKEANTGARLDESHACVGRRVLHAYSMCHNQRTKPHRQHTTHHTHYFQQQQHNIN